MITAGIDVGIEYTKAVVMADGKLLGCGTAVSGGAGRNDAAQTALDAALREAGHSREELGRIFATGKGKYDVSFADKCITEAITLARGARYYCPDATLAVSFGADEMLALALGEGDAIEEAVLNQKCSAGVGTFLRTMARRLEISYEDMSAADVSGEEIETQDGCIVFAELGALSMLNRGKSPQEVASAVTKAAAVRAAVTLHDVILADTSKVFYAGGLVRNDAFMRALENRVALHGSSCDRPEFVSAVGAALLAADAPDESA